MLHERNSFYLGGIVIPPITTDKITGSLNQNDTVYLGIDDNKIGTIKFANGSTVTTTAGYYGADNDKTCPITGAVEIKFPTNNEICGLMAETPVTKLRGAVAYNGDGKLDLNVDFVTTLTANESLNLYILDNIGGTFTSFAASKVKTLIISLDGTASSTLITSICQTIKAAKDANRALISYDFTYAAKRTEIKSAFDTLYSDTFDETENLLIAVSPGLGGTILYKAK